MYASRRTQKYSKDGKRVGDIQTDQIGRRGCSGEGEPVRQDKRLF